MFYLGICNKPQKEITVEHYSYFAKQLCAINLLLATVALILSLGTTFCLFLSVRANALQHFYLGTPVMRCRWFFCYSNLTSCGVADDIFSDRGLSRIKESRCFDKKNRYLEHVKKNSNRFQCK